MKFLKFLPLILIFSGCTTASHVMIGDGRPPISLESVRLYDEMPPNAKKIAILSGTTSMVKPDAAIRAMKREAAKLGANGIVITKAQADWWKGGSTAGEAIFVP